MHMVRTADERPKLREFSYGLVKCYDDGHWEPKRLFHALAGHNASATSA
jgi:hypothetical protein